MPTQNADCVNVGPNLLAASQLGCTLHWPEHNMSQDSEMLKGIEGSQLSSVEFVLDYVQLRFNGVFTLTVYTWPSIRRGAVMIKWGDVEFRNALCDLITHTVLSTSVRPEEVLEITFDDNTVFGVSLKDDDYVCPEAITFSDGSKLCVL